MRVGSIRAGLAWLMAGLLLASCSAASDTPSTSDAAAQVSDVGPADPQALRDGGNLRLAVGAIPANFNPWHVDGSSDGGMRIMGATLPSAFVTDTTGELIVNRDYFTDISMTGTNPHRITYTINPKAVWSDGAPITWEDLRSQVTALQSADPDFVFDRARPIRVDKVERGIDDRQAIVTFLRPYSMWQRYFSVLLPRKLTETPDAFNRGAVDNPQVSAGPFLVTEVDRGHGRVVLSRNPRWWGHTPRLETITLVQINRVDGWVSAIENGQVDATEIQGSVSLAAARTLTGFDIRQAGGQMWTGLGFVQNEGALADPWVRSAVSKAIDRDAMVAAVGKSGIISPRQLGNRFYLPGTTAYSDNSVTLTYDPAAAGRALEAVGWKLNGAVRERDGRQLVLRYEERGFPEAARSVLVDNLAAVGIRVERFSEQMPVMGTIAACEVSVPCPAYSAFPKHLLSAREPSPPDIVLFTDYVTGAGVDVTDSFWGGPRSSLTVAIESEFDAGRATELVNNYDRTLWEAGDTVPLYLTTDTHIVRSNLANWGPFGPATPDYAKIGFTK